MSENDDTGVTAEESAEAAAYARMVNAPGEMVILAARHLDATEGPVQVGCIVDTAARSAITTVLRYIAKAHNGPASQEWTPPPPGDTREQLPDHILELIRPYLKPYVCTACETAYAIVRRLHDMNNHTAVGLAQELCEWQDRLWERCRENQKFTGQLCIHPHHTHNDDDPQTT